MDTAVLISCMALTATLLIVLLLLCRLVQPHDIAWFLSSREDKLKLSKMRLYNANGYLMHSGSEILLGSTGSFQRFDSVDRDYKPQYGPRSGISFPSWRNSTEEPDIPPQPLRPAPSPREAKLSREKPILRQISEPKAPTSRTVFISPIPRPVPRKQHSAPISFPLLISPQEKQSNKTVRPPQTVPVTQHHPCTNPFLNTSQQQEELLHGISKSCHQQVSPLIPSPLTVPHSAVSSSSEFHALKSANNPFIDSPVASSKTYDQPQQQPQQQFCVFNFDPAMVQSLFNRPVPGVLEDDTLRGTHKRINNLRRMSRLIESNQLLLNIYQQFNRTISEQPELPLVVTPHVSKPLMPLTSPIATQLPVTSSDATQASTAETSVEAQPRSLSPVSEFSAIFSKPPLMSPRVSSGDRSSPCKYRDSPRSDITESIRVPTVSRSIKHILRNRSYSETEFSQRKLIKSQAILSISDGYPHQASASNACSVPPSPLAKNASYKDLSQYQWGSAGANVGSASCGYLYSSRDSLQKTVSESFLEQYSLTQHRESNETAGERQMRYGINSSGIDSSRIEQNPGTVLPSSSCESVASESSVVFTDLIRSPSHPAAGYLCVGLQLGSTTDDREELLVTVREAKDLVLTPEVDEVDTFVKVLLIPTDGTARQTKVCKHAKQPSYQETFSYCISNRKAVRHSLWFYVYLNSANSQTLIGEAEIQLDENVQLPVTSWMKLIDPSHRNLGLGELMLSLSYLPTAERLTVVVVKARNLALKNRGINESKALESETGLEPDGAGNVFVKVYLLQNDRKISKKKTSVKRAEQFPIYNEAIIFSLPPYMLNVVQIRLSVVQMVQRVEACVSEDLSTNGRKPSVDGVSRKPSVKLVSLGHVIIGSGTTGKGLRHWHQMLTALRKPVAMWHGLRSTSEQHRRDKPNANDGRVKQ
ncbi:synaptotagmin-12 [Anopheles sinensis]|uniref:Synaptotagmin-12 n=1 Tax=Anopheles sinensis TaxID=74873 RepID=A0A084VV56_ANOSI|nr:synaptotagmin-12 [Anopheles sinensis]